MRAAFRDFQDVRVDRRSEGIWATLPAGREAIEPFAAQKNDTLADFPVSPSQQIRVSFMEQVFRLHSASEPGIG
jgi:hypothetical protein